MQSPVGSVKAVFCRPVCLQVRDRIFTVAVEIDQARLKVQAVESRSIDKGFMFVCQGSLR